MKGNKLQIHCVIYDCDGVLFDSLDQNKRLYNHIAVSLGRAPVSDAEALYCHTHTLQESIRHIFQNDEEKYAEAMSFWKSDVKFEDFIGYLKMEPHVIDVLSELRRRRMKTAISTNRTNTMAFIMDVFSLNQYFDMVVTALPEDVRNPKPHPESVYKILAALNVGREHVLYIGDSEVDRKTARASGVFFAAYKNNDLEADYLINDHLDLLAVLSDG